jgi:hypothetical protein
MSETFSKVEVITGVARRRPTEQKLSVVNETLRTHPTGTVLFDGDILRSM